MPSIPRLIHQTGPTEQVPQHLQGLQESWARHNPDFAYRFWSDADLEAFVAAEAPEFLEIYRGYPRGIFRADLGRYLVLRRFGGIYADLDCQCLRPLDPLLAEHRFVIAAEPEAHSALGIVQRRGLTQVLCPSFLAAEPGHPFWEAVLEAIRRARHESDVLDATGPFLLTRVFQAWTGGGVSVVDSAAIYPFDKDECLDGRVFDLGRWEERTREAFVVHYWESSWFQPSLGFLRGVPSRVPVNLRQPDWPTLREADPAAASPAGEAPATAVPGGKEGAVPPLISCLMVTRGRVPQALVAVECFLRQTYPHRELVVIDDDPDDRLARALEAVDTSRIRHIRLPDEGRPLGALRNIALEQAHGAYVCQWDDDDLHDPLRLEMQLRVVRQSGSQACVLVRWTTWWPRSGRLAVSNQRHWEGSLLCERSVMPRYPELRRGEDSAVLQRLLASVRLARMDLPRLYLYVAHGANTFEDAHFEAHWQAASLRWEPEQVPRVLTELARRLPIQRYLDALAQQENERASAGEPPLPSARPSSPADGSAVPAAVTAGAAGPSARSDTTERWPSVLIATPMKNAEGHLDRYLALLQRLDYDPALLTLAVLEGDSSDDTHDGLQRRLEALGPRWRRVQVHRWDAHPTPPTGERWEPSAQRQRRRILAEARNRLLQGSLEQEEWVLWLDADLLDYPPDLLRQLLGSGRDVVTPHCRLPDGASFDLNTFRHLPGHGAATERRDHLIDGLVQPPRGVGRAYLDAFPDHPLLEVDSVGATALLVRAELHRSGFLFPPQPVEGYIETEGFARQLRAADIRCWALPQLTIRHGAW